MFSGKKEIKSTSGLPEPKLSKDGEVILDGGTIAGIDRIYIAAALGVLSFFISHIVLFKLAALLSQVTARYRVKPPTSYFGLMGFLSAPWLIVTITLALAVGVFVTYRFYKGKPMKDRRGFEFASSAEHGSAVWLTRKEIAKRDMICSKKNPKGYILGKLPDGKVVCRTFDSKNHMYDLNQNILIIGPPGTKKSRGQFGPNILQAAMRGEPLVIADSKGDLYEKYAGMLKELGYEKIRLIVAKGGLFKHSDGVDILKIIRNDESPIAAAQMMAEAWLSNTNTDHYWYTQNYNLLTALILLTALPKNYKQEEEWSGSIPDTKDKTLRQVVKYCNKGIDSAKESIEDDGNGLKQIFDDLQMANPLHPAIEFFNNFMETPNAPNIRSSLAVELSKFGDPALSAILSEDEVNFEELRDSKTAYFIVTDDRVSTYAFITALIFTFMFYVLVEKADDARHGVTEKPISFILDEFPNLGLIPDFDKKISTLRSRNIPIILCTQGLEQLQNRYERDWESIINCCDTTIVLGANNNTTMTYLEKMIGSATLKRRQEMISAGPLERMFPFLAVNEQHRMSEQLIKRPLMTADEFRTMENYRMVVMTAHSQPMELYKYDISEHPLMKTSVSQAKKMTVVEHIPAWRQREMENYEKRYLKMDGYEESGELGTDLTGYEEGEGTEELREEKEVKESVPSFIDEYLSEADEEKKKKEDIRTFEENADLRKYADADDIRDNERVREEYSPRMEEREEVSDDTRSLVTDSDIFDDFHVEDEIGESEELW